MEPDSVEFVFNVVGRQLPKAWVEFLMIGGHAVNHYGYSRATLDVDFMIAESDAAIVRSVMKEAGFTNISESENVVFFHYPEALFRVGFLQIDSDSMQKLIAGAQQIEYGGQPLKVPHLLDLIAMKLFALKCGSAKREEKDFPDIVNLALEHGLDVEADLKPLCVRFADERIYAKLVERIRGVEHG